MRLKVSKISEFLIWDFFLEKNAKNPGIGIWDPTKFLTQSHLWPGPKLPPEVFPAPGEFPVNTAQKYDWDLVGKYDNNNMQLAGMNLKRDIG